MQMRRRRRFDFSKTLQQVRNRTAIAILRGHFLMVLPMRRGQATRCLRLAAPCLNQAGYPWLNMFP
jgi:hypothetical protein